MSEPATVIATGANAPHFSNLTMLLASWRTHHADVPLVVCDYGLTAEQVAIVRAIPGVHYAPGPKLRGTHAWEGKARLGEYVVPPAPAWENLVWIDADAIFLRPLPPLGEVMAGYDVIVDAHVQSTGAIIHEGNLRALGLRDDDAYFSSGFWIVRRGCLLESFATLAERVRGQGNLWENDAFVAAIYQEKLKVRTVSGGVWHARGKTSLHTCEVKGLNAFHCGQSIYVVHANDGYTVRADGRRIFNRPELAAIQDHYEQKFWREVVGSR